MVGRIVMRTATLAGVATLLVAGAVASQAASTPGWRVVTTFAVQAKNVRLTSVTAPSARDAWATGSVTGTSTAALVVHWNGTSWQQVALPAAARDRLGAGPEYALQASSASNVWLYSQQGWARWTGRGWQSGKLPVASRGESSQAGQLLVFSPTDVWLVGSYATGSTQRSFAERYNGSRWQSMPAPGITDFQAAASSPSDICAVNGNYGSADGTTNVVTCWNGKRWSHLPLPASLDHQNAILASIVVSSPSDIWIGGGASISNGIAGLAANWTGRGWHVQTLPVPTTLGDDVLNVLSPDGHGGLWAVGDCDCGGPAWRLWHYTAGSWTGPVLPAIGGTYGLLDGIAAVPGTDSAWAAGTRGTASVSDGVILAYGRLP
jgi:hypothetical protein